jgi:lipopolysaccharide heptosyltransferase I
MDNKYIAKILAFAVSALGATLRKKILNDDHYYPKPAIYPFWHSNEFAMLVYNKHSDIVIMSSLSKDGELMTYLLEKFGYIAVRGSSSRGAERALIEMIRYARKGYSLAFAADGPRGPYHKLKSGVVYAAQKTGMPLLPVCSSVKTKIILNKAWDKLRIPLPFSKAVQIYGNPIYVNPEDNLEEKTLEVEKALNNMFEFADIAYWQKDIKKYLQLHPFPKILIVQPSRLGDIVFSLPVVTALKKKYPHAKISWLVDERCADILQGHPDIDNLIIWDRKKRNFKYYKDLAKQLRGYKFDLSIDLHGLFKSAAFVKLAGAKFKIASSSTNGMRELSWLFSKEIKTPETCHCVDRHFEVAKFLGIEGTPEFKIYVSDEDKNITQKILTDSGAILSKPVIVIHIGGGWASRRWGIENFSALIDKINENLDANIVLIGGKEGGKSEKGLNDKLKDLTKTKFIDLTDKLTLKQLCALFLMTKVVVANDSGPMHIASAALNVATIGLLGPTNAKKTRPYGSNSITIQHDFDCRPQNYPCTNRDCKNPVCMQSISVDEVYEAVRSKVI